MVVLVTLGVKNLIKKNKEEPKKEESKKEELKKEESKKEEPKKEEPKKEELKKEESKTDGSQEVDAVDYILGKTKEKIEEYINRLRSLNVNEKVMGEAKSDTDKVFSMIESYFNKIKEENRQCQRNIKELTNYFNGTSKMQSENICVYFTESDLLTILSFDNCSCYINVYKYNDKFRLKCIVVKNKGIINTYKKYMPPDNSGEIISISESDLLK